MISDTTTGIQAVTGELRREMPVFCVQLAGAGWTGVKDALLSEGGY